MTENLLNQNTEYLFSSPRYNTLRNQTTNLIPEDYGYYDSINGTYDLYYPCYSLDENDVPKMKLINQYGNETIITTGDIDIFVFKGKHEGKQVGKVENPANPHNSTLEKKKVYYTQYMFNKLNPGWSILQTRPTKNSNNKEEYSPFLLVRLLGTKEVCNQIFSIDLDDKTIKSGHVPFKIGVIVKYKESDNINETKYNIWKCIADTKELPPRKADITNSSWKLCDYTFNVFNADIFALGENKINYFTEINNADRKFHPDKEDETLICWNASYFFN